MTAKQGTSKRKLAAIAAIVAALAGGATAAVTAVGQGNSRHGRHVHVGGHSLSARDAVAASAYLGVGESELGEALRAGKSLAQIADATPGRSAAGLEAALVDAKRNRLSSLEATLPKRVSAEVHRSGPFAVRTRRRGAARAAGTSGGDRLAQIAAGYLGASPAALQGELQSGRTLAQIANATSGRSAAGLIGTLVAARREWLSAGVGAHRLTPTRAKSIEARLIRRVTAIVNRTPRG